MKHDWEGELKPYVAENKIKELSQLVKKKRKKGQIIEYVVILVAFLFVGLLLALVGNANVLKIEIDLRTGVINGIVAFALALITFFSPIKSTSISPKEVNSIIVIEITEDIMAKIRSAVESKTAKMEKPLAVIGACGIFGSALIKLFN